MEDLRASDLVVTAGRDPGLRPLVWTGRLHAHVARHPDRAKVAPVLVRAGALHDGVPHRDLRVSPDHALYLDGALVPAKLLLDGVGIVQELWCPAVTYHHLELAGHGVLVAEGALAESDLDCGNRHLFDARITPLAPDFARGGVRARARRLATAIGEQVAEGMGPSICTH